MFRTAFKAIPGFIVGLGLAAPAWAGLHPPDPNLTPPPAPAATASDTQVYIVQLRGPPAPVPSRRAAQRVRAAAVQGSGEDLVRRHDAVLHAVGADGTKLYSYRHSFNGFAARLTAGQAAKLRAHRDVAGVWADRLRHTNTSDSAAFLGLLDHNDGLRTAARLQGDDIVIGVIDSGITTGHPSFADSVPAPKPRFCRGSWARSSLLGKWLCARFLRAKQRVVYTPPANWHAPCQSGPGFPATTCNNKLIGARFYAAGFQQAWTLDANESLSPLDVDGHGTHIASTAAGNSVKANLGGTDVAQIAGMAPRARIAVYKACWLEPGAIRGSCAMSDLQQAIEDAVADGVDVISYSVGTPGGSVTDPDGLALLNAADAGIVTVVAAGNSGPDAGTVESPGTAPWALTVGAASRAGTRYDHAIRVTTPGTVAVSYAAKEAAFTPTLRSTGPITEDLVLVNDGFAALTSTATGTTWDACEAVTNGGALSGKIALISRGICNFETKLKNAQSAGARAAVVFSNTSETIVMDGTRGTVSIPAVLISNDAGESLRARLAAGDAVQVTLDARQIITQHDAGNVMGSFSSRGPDLEIPDLVKPDVAAPGVDILAAQTPVVANGLRGEYYQYLSGTSMAVPHVAGIAALLRQAHPDWSPAAIRSALVTTARQDVLKDDGVSAADPFDLGGGYIVPNRATAPGLVYDAATADYEAFLCGAGSSIVTAERCAELVNLGARTAVGDLNLPSIGVAALAVASTVHRRVTNLGPPATWSAVVEAPPGVAVSVDPASISLGTGEQQDFAVTLRNLGDATESWAFGSLTWQGTGTAVRSPLAVRTTALIAPAEVSGTTTTGSIGFPVQFGYSGSYAATAYGLSTADPAGTAAPLFVANDPLHNYVSGQDTASLPASVARYVYPVPPGSVFLRVALYQDETDANADLDLYVYCPGGQCSAANPVLAAASPTSDESIDIRYPDPGDYIIDVHGYQTDGAGAHFRLFVWSLGPDGQPTLQVTAPGTVSSGDTNTVTASWQDLAPATRYLGGVGHGDGSQNLGLTVISVRTP